MHPQEQRAARAYKSGSCHTRDTRFMMVFPAGGRSSSSLPPTFFSALQMSYHLAPPFSNNVEEAEQGGKRWGERVRAVPGMKVVVLEARNVHAAHGSSNQPLAQSPKELLDDDSPPCTPAQTSGDCRGRLRRGGRL